MFCKNCGNELSEEARFCVSCGTPVTVKVVAEKNLEEQNVEENQPVKTVVEDVNKNNPFYNAAVEEAKRKSERESLEKREKEKEKAIKAKKNSKVTLIVVLLISIAALAYGGILIYKYVSSNIEMKADKEKKQIEEENARKKAEEEYEENIENIYGRWIYDVDESEMIAIDSENMGIMDFPTVKSFIAIDDDGSFSAGYICEGYDEDYLKEYLACYYMTINLASSFGYEEYKNSDSDVSFTKWREERYGSDDDIIMDLANYNKYDYILLITNLFAYDKDNNTKQMGANTNYIEDIAIAADIYMTQNGGTYEEGLYYAYLAYFKKVKVETNMNISGTYTIDEYEIDASWLYEETEVPWGHFEYDPDEEILIVTTLNGSDMEYKKGSSSSKQDEDEENDDDDSNRDSKKKKNKKAKGN